MIFQHKQFDGTTARRISVIVSGESFIQSEKGKISITSTDQENKEAGYLNTLVLAAVELRLIVRGIAYSVGGGAGSEKERQAEEKGVGEQQGEDAVSLSRTSESRTERWAYYSPLNLGLYMGLIL